MLIQRPYSNTTALQRLRFPGGSRGRQRAAVPSDAKHPSSPSGASETRMLFSAATRISHLPDAEQRGAWLLEQR